ncbi:MAG: hypothetical protein WED00_08905 [Aquisalimonadaceae bacterium]
MGQRRLLDGHYASLEDAMMDWQRMTPVGPQLRHPACLKIASSFTGHCRGCGEEIADRDLRGRVEVRSSTSLSLFALGVCLECRCITPFEYILLARDGHLVVESARCTDDEAAEEQYEPGMRELLANLQRLTGSS